MTWTLRLIVAMPLIIAVAIFFNLFLQPNIQSVNEFKVETVRYSNAHIYKYGISRTYHAIKIVGENAEYGLYPFETFLPAGMTLKSIHAALSKSNHATIWTEYGDEIRVVKGIETEYLKIPPTQGLKFVQHERQLAIWASLFLIAASIGCYIYFKRYYGLDWKLNFPTVSPTVSKSFRQSSHKRSPSR